MSKELIDKFELAIRMALFIFTLTIGVFVILAGVKSASAATLKSNSIVSGEYIKLGDIFNDVKNADYILGPAPQPGTDMILNARTLYKIASALDVSWSPATSSEQLVLTRDASIIPQMEITTSLEERLKKNGVDGKFSIQYINAPSDIVLPGGTNETLEVTALNLDPRSDTFNAVIVAPSAENPLKRINVTGRIDRLIAVPVLFNTLKNGDIISARDIDWMDMPQKRVANGTILNEKDLINLTPRRTISGGKPMISNELEHPKMVDRGDAITIVFESGPMVLTTKGKAMQAGAMGDMIRISNVDSNKNLQGVVTAHREVTIR